MEPRYHHKSLIVSIFIVTALITISTQAEANSKRLNIVETPDALQPKFADSFPIKSEAQALSFALYTNDILPQLLEMEKRASFAKWTSKALLKNDTWVVTVSSKGMLPSYHCSITFTAEGKITSVDKKTFCRSNK